MPKGKTPSLLSMSLGRPKKIEVLRESHCKRCKLAISKIQECFVIPTHKNGRSVEKRYCRECMQGIMSQTYKELSSINEELGLDSSEGNHE